MAGDLGFEVRSEGPLAEGGEGLTRRVFEAAREAVGDIADYFQREVVRRTPSGATGALRASIRARVRGQTLDALRGEVASPLAYARTVEYGRPPGSSIPPWRAGSPLYLWTRRRVSVGDGEVERVSFLIARAIGRRGIRGRFMFRDAFEAGRGWIEERVGRLGEEIARRLGG